MVTFLLLSALEEILPKDEYGPQKSFIDHPLL
jgi:hypothetical protein